MPKTSIPVMHSVTGLDREQHIVLCTFIVDTSSMYNKQQNFIISVQMQGFGEMLGREKKRCSHSTSEMGERSSTESGQG